MDGAYCRHSTSKCECCCTCRTSSGRMPTQIVGTFQKHFHVFFVFIPKLHLIFTILFSNLWSIKESPRLMLFSTDCLWWAPQWEIGMWLLQFYVMSSAISFTILRLVTTSSHVAIFVSLDLIFYHICVHAFTGQDASTAGSHPVYLLIG